MGSRTVKKTTMATDAKDDAAAKAALNETLKEYINEWRKTREKEEEELKKLKEKQAKRKEIRAEQEKKLNQQKKEEEEKLRKEENEKKAKEAEEKKKRLEEAEAKRQEMLEAQKADKQGAGGAKKAGGAGGDARREMTKTMDTDDLKDKAKELFNIVIALETDKYDYEQRRITQDYELNELKERQKAQLRQKALKKGLDPEAFSGKYPPPIRMYSKYERRTDTRTYEDRKKLYEGGWEVIRAESMDAIWKEKYEEWTKRPSKKLPKWFGERPGKKAGDAPTPEGEEDGGEEAAAEEEYDEEEEEEEEYDEEE